MEEERQIRVRFVTKLPPHLRVPPTPFSVPSHLARYGLSEVINALLGLGNGELALAQVASF
jgi:ribosome biogenesis protein YTM1